MVSMPLSSNNLASLNQSLSAQPTQSNFRTDPPPYSGPAVIQPQRQNSIGGIPGDVIARMLEDQAQRGVAAGPPRESRSTPSNTGSQHQDDRLHPRTVAALKIAQIGTMYAEPFKPPPPNALCNRCGTYIKNLDQFYDLPCEHRFHLECLEQTWNTIMRADGSTDVRLEDSIFSRAHYPDQDLFALRSILLSRRLSNPTPVTMHEREEANEWLQYYNNEIVLSPSRNGTSRQQQPNTAGIAIDADAEEEWEEDSVDDGFFEQTRGPHPRLATAVAGLKILEIADTDQAYQDCIICLEEYKIGDVCYVLPCGHIFRLLCMAPLWREKPNGECPMCRKSIIPGYIPRTANGDSEMTTNNAGYARWRLAMARRGRVLRTRVYSSDGDGVTVVVVDFIEYAAENEEASDDHEELDEVEDSDTVDDNHVEEHDSGVDESDVQDNDTDDSDLVSRSPSQDTDEESDSDANEEVL
ncbi:MAG: hypothetical protein Q9165_002852 [Trypethelium subeluteriae]